MSACLPMATAGTHDCNGSSARDLTQDELQHDDDSLGLEATTHPLHHAVSLILPKGKKMERQCDVGERDI